MNRNLIEKYCSLVEVLACKESKNNLVRLEDEAYFMFNFKDMRDFCDSYLAEANWIMTGEFEQHFKMPKINRSERIEIYNIEKYEREMVLNDLKFATHINMTKFNEPFSSRRFLTTNDSCLSFAQVSVDDTYFRWMFVSRSTEVNRMLPADLYTIGVIIKEWTDWFCSGRRSETMGVKLTIVMNNPHYYKE